MVGQQKHYYTILEQHHLDYEPDYVIRLDENLYTTLHDAKQAIHDLIIEWDNATDSFSATIYKIDIQNNTTSQVFQKRKKARQQYQSQQQYHQQSDDKNTKPQDRYTRLMNSIEVAGDALENILKRK